MKRLSVLGSTGSIGTQTLDVCRNLGFEVVALAAGSNVELLEKQAREFKPKFVAVYDEEAAKGLSIRLFDTGIPVPMKMCRQTDRNRVDTYLRCCRYDIL